MADRCDACLAEVDTLAAGLTPEQLATPIPATPGWTVHQVLAHPGRDRRVTEDNPRPAIVWNISVHLADLTSCTSCRCSARATTTSRSLVRRAAPPR